MSMTAENCNIIIIDDCREDREEIRKLLLQQDKRKYKFIESKSGESGLHAIQNANPIPDCVISAYKLPDMSAPEILRSLTKANGLAPCPVIVLTSSAEHHLGKEVLHSGAQDYLGKEWITAESLTRSVENAISRHELMRELQKREMPPEGQDITERIEAEKALRESKEQNDLLAKLIQSSSQPMVIGYPDGRLGIFNRAFQELTGYSADELHSVNWKTELTPPEWRDFEHQKLEDLKSSGQPIRYEKEYIRKDGRRVAIELLVHLVPNEKGEALYYYTFLTDISNRKLAEKALCDAKESAEAANRAKSEFLANMSHEIRTPLNALVGLSTILDMDESLSVKQKEMINTIKLSSQSLMDLVNNLLDMTKIETRDISLKRMPFSMHEIINEAAYISREKAKDKNINLEIVDRPGKDMHYLGDPQRVRQILMNLISNAVKFTARGSVFISCDISAGPDLSHDCIRISVNDTGIGIAQENLKSVFDKFTQADSTNTRIYGGTGLGLAISKSLAEYMGGSITVQSEIDKGSQFILHLTLERCAEDFLLLEAKQSAPKIAYPKMPLPAKQLTILLVDDYRANILVAEYLLDGLGLKHESAYSGEEALTKIRTKRENYCLILMDLQMPKLDGLEITRMIRQDEKLLGLLPIPIFAMTASGMDKDRKRCLEVGMNDHINKPFEPEELVALLKKYRIDNCLPVPIESFH